MPPLSQLTFRRLAVFVAVALLGSGCGSREDAGIRTSLSVREHLGAAPDVGFARALEPRAFRFPDDHGPHPAFRSEWWYLTGNLSGPDAEPYGFQLTIFRSALGPAEAQRAASASGAASAWRTEQIYMGHLALTDGQRGSFHAFERFARGALGLAGATAMPFRVWLDDWEIAGPVGETADIFPLRLRAAEQGFGLSLRLTPAKSLVLQGDAGLSQKGPEPGNASYYYSFTRLEASGEIQLGGRTARVEGLAWLDREWSTSALSTGQVGWDWFALQLDDGSDFMYYQLRRSDGSPDPHSQGILVGPGRATSAAKPSSDSDAESGANAATRSRLESGQVELAVLDRWSSPLDGSIYPSGWRIAVPTEDLVLELTPLLRDQELDLSFRYWEGAVRVAGTRRGRAIRGKGYVELTGYTDQGMQDQAGRTSRSAAHDE